ATAREAERVHGRIIPRGRGAPTHRAVESGVLRARPARTALLLSSMASLAALAPLAGCRGEPVPFAEIAVLTDDNFDAMAPAGKEADGIDGDFVMRNDRIVAVIGAPVPRRDANITLQGVGGAVIDLTGRDRQNDLLGAFYPG